MAAYALTCTRDLCGRSRQTVATIAQEPLLWACSRSQVVIRSIGPVGIMVSRDSIVRTQTLPCSRMRSAPFTRILCCLLHWLVSPSGAETEFNKTGLHCRGKCFDSCE